MAGVLDLNRSLNELLAPAAAAILSILVTLGMSFEVLGTSETLAGVLDGEDLTDFEGLMAGWLEVISSWIWFS